MKKNSYIFIAYGVFLILIGVIGYLSNPEKAKTALMSGGVFGMASIGLGLLALQRWPLARVLGLAMSGFLGLVFIWRSSVSWMAVAGGETGKTLAAVLISAMLLATIGLATVLLRRGSATVPAGVSANPAP